MTTLTVSAAARLCGVDRRTLQRAIQAGRLPLDAQHCLSPDALIAAGYLDAMPQGMPHSTPQDTSQGTPHGTPQDTPHLTPHVTPLPSPQILGTYDPRAAAARIHTLRRQGRSFVQI